MNLKMMTTQNEINEIMLEQRVERMKEKWVKGRKFAGWNKRPLEKKSGKKHGISVLKKGTYTVEASVIVPIIIISIAALIGYCYFTHQDNWCRAVSYESLLYGNQRREKGVSAQEMVDNRIGLRLEQTPLTIGEYKITGHTDSSEGTANWDGIVLSNMFNGIFDFSGQVQVYYPDPVKMVRVKSIINELSNW